MSLEMPIILLLYVVGALVMGAVLWEMSTYDSEFVPIAVGVGSVIWPFMILGAAIASLAWLWGLALSYVHSTSKTAYVALIKKKEKAKASA